MQKELIFFDVDSPPSSEALKWEVDPTNPDCPYHRYIGNEKVVRRLSRSAFTAMTRPNHVANDQSFSLIGPASSGKTSLAKLHAEVLGLPFVKIQPQSIKRVNDVLFEIAKVLEQTHGPDGESLVLRPVNRENYFIIPPTVVFIDEVHALRDKVVQGLLNATEHDDAEMVTERGYVASTKNVSWLIATTDRGLLFDAFDTRFEKLELKLFSQDEMARIVHHHYPTLPFEVAKSVAKFSGRVPREALSFARDLILTRNMESGNWDAVVAKVAEEREIDSFGMTYQRVKILTSLGQRPVPANQLARIAGCKVEELQKFIMPSLMVSTPDQEEPLVVVSSGRGYCITPAGLDELNKRNIPNNGTKALPKDMQVAEV